MEHNIEINPEQGFVKKVFINQDYFRRELGVYQMRLPFIPRLLNVKVNELLIEYISSPSIGELTQPDLIWAAASLARFHNHFRKGKVTLCHKDTNPKNYLMTKDNCIMIDFSDVEYDNPYSDIISFNLFQADIMHPDIFPKQLDSFFKTYKMFHNSQLQLSPQILAQELTRFAERRKTFGKKLSSHYDVNSKKLMEFFANKVNY